MLNNPKKEKEYQREYYKRSKRGKIHAKNKEERKNESEKKCSSCGIIKEISEFRRYKKDSRDNETKHTVCRDCNNWMIRERYSGFSREKFIKRLSAQNERCEICGTDDPGTKRGWSGDHHHGENYTRGILCQRCNVLLTGLDSDIYEKLQAYLARHSRV